MHLGAGSTCSCAAWPARDTPTVDGVPFGVVSWRPPAALVVALSDLLAGLMTLTDDPYAADVPWRATGLLAPGRGGLTRRSRRARRPRLGAIGGEDGRAGPAGRRARGRGAAQRFGLRGPRRVAERAPHDATPLRRSPLVADGPDGPADRPLRWVDGRVYLDRYWRDEQTVRYAIGPPRRAGPADPDALSSAIDRLFPCPPTTPSARRSARPRPRT